MGKRKRTNSLRECCDQQKSCVLEDDEKDSQDRLKCGVLNCEVDGDINYSEQPYISSADSVNLRSVPQLRTSIRVQNKQKKDNEASGSVVIKQIDKEIELRDEEGCEADTESRGGGKKRRRAWELWSAYDKDMFFEAINECGKDFEAMQNYISTKMKKKGTPSYLIKNKDQIRHFYYRTWHKISKNLKFTEDVKKSTQEVYALINFGELRKKIKGAMDERNAPKLEELIQKGSTSVRIKGKSIRVKTPICRALKKLNDFIENRDQGEQRLPTSVIVEMVPGTMKTWCRVQNIAQNPRIRCVCFVHHKLLSLILYLEKKWRNSQYKLLETLAANANVSINLPKVDGLLRVLPPKDCSIKVLNVQIDPHVKSTSVSFLSHEANLKKKGNSNKKKNRDKFYKQNSAKSPDHSRTNEVNCDTSQDEADEGSDAEDQTGSPDVDVIEILSPKTPVNNYSTCIKEEPVSPCSPPAACSSPSAACIDPHVEVKDENDETPSQAIRQLLALETVAGFSSSQEDDEVVCIGETTCLVTGRSIGSKPNEDNESQNKELAKSFSDPQVQEQIVQKTKRIQDGWTAQSSGNITIGELYLMFGQEKKLTLEYVFDSAVKKDSESPLDKLCKNTENSSTTENAETIEKNEIEVAAEDSNAQTEDDEKQFMVDNLSSMLIHLLSLAKVIRNTPSASDSCLCGFTYSRAPVGFRSPAANKYLALGKSPHSTRSPKTAAVRSPRNLYNSSKSPSAIKTIVNCDKPLAAKRLIPENAEDKVVKPVESDSCIANTSVGTTVKPFSSSGNETFQTSVTGIPSSEVVKSIDSDKFLVPLAPAPRISTPSQSYFNVQLNKIWPRARSRACRRVMRKNYIVQRQLPLLPKTPENFFAIKVLPQATQFQNTSVAVNIAQSLSPKIMSTCSLAASMHPTEPVSQPVQINSMPTLSDTINGTPSTACNAISVKVSGHPLLTVEIPPSVSSNTSQSVSGVSVGSSSALLSVPVQTNDHVLGNTFQDLCDLTTPPSTPALHNPAAPSFPKSKTELLDNHSLKQAIKAESERLSFSNLLSSSNSPVVPEIHIPEGSVSPSFLNITLNEASGVLSNGQDCFKATNEATAVYNTQSVGFSENSCDKMLDITLGNSSSNTSFSTLLAAAVRTPKPEALNENSLLQTPPRPVGVVSGEGCIAPVPFAALNTTPPSSPSRLLHQSENQWFSSEINDFSFSSLLGHLESPLKGGQSNCSSDVTRGPTSMTNLISMLSENSIDFTAKFAEQKASKDG